MLCGQPGPADWLEQRWYELALDFARSRYALLVDSDHYVAYFEDPAYVPMTTCAWDLWRELERRSGEHLLTASGVVSVAAVGDAARLVPATLEAAGRYGLPNKAPPPRAA